ncbi:poor homologous synapsis 1 [Raphanus sativus]|uniref:Protein POOR HOMOLOGOUS SYNAPSIS 1 n=1 Tax=Raphanus sativus TaxID=3726 RepID=A0A6J0NXN2_RAPSA|nr:protein POOR HOMOLOGOUS SYNAPSIS 1 [Raphanus sativus]KAJ4895581.1 poor homologous synapsis 1 [Raphanus sativus]
MAGSLTASVHRGNAEASGNLRWLISFARFIPFPSSPSPYPGLVPLGKRELSSSPIGTWLSTSFSKVYLTLVDAVNRSDAILSVELAGKVLEEHYISKLNFSWPHMTCVSGFPPRGSRAILVSYMDSENEIQKFALRFSTCDAAVTFVAALKEKLKGLEEAGIQEREPDTSFQSDYNTGNEIIIPRATEEEPNLFRPPNSYVPEMLPRLEYQQSATAEEPNMVKHLGSYVPEMQPRLEYQTGQTFYTPQIAAVEEPTMVKHIGSYVPEIQPRLEYQTGQTLYRPQSTLSQIPNDSFSNLPPSFTTLLSGCFPNSTLDAGQTTIKQDPELKSQILKYMEDSSFHDMLQKVERVMEEIGGSWIP